MYPELNPELKTVIYIIFKILNSQYGNISK